MKNSVRLVIGVIALVLIVWAVALNDTPRHQQQPGNDEILVTHPKGEPISSPVMVHGFVKSSWVFEANLPVVIVDWDGRIIGEGHATTDSDWMEPKMVQFEGIVSFAPPECATGQDYCKRGAIIFKNDNPSGEPSRDKAFELPVTFK